MLAAKIQSPQSKTESPAAKAKNPGQAPAEPAFNPVWARLALGLQPNSVAGEYVPGTLEGQQQPAHEPVYALPQGPPATLRRQLANPADGNKAEAARSHPEPQSIGDGGDPHEATADRRAGTAASNGGRGGAVPSSVRAVLGSPGAELEAGRRYEVGTTLGADLDNVRIHAGPNAAASAREIGADAYSFGDHVVLGSAFRGGDPASEALLRHELAHVAANRDRPNAAVRRGVLPGYAQKGETCDPASLVTALLIWDRENASPTAPSANIVKLCNSALIYMSQNRASLIASWSAGGKDGNKRFADAEAGLAAIRTDALKPGATVSETQFQQIAQTLSDFGGDIGDIERKLGLTAKTQLYNTLDEIWKSAELAGLGNDQIAQIEWYVNTKVATTQGAILPSTGYHAFLIGRQKTGKWFISDQGNKPPYTAEADSLADLRAKVEADAKAGTYWLDTNPARSRLLLTWSGVRVLGSPASLENVNKALVSPGTFVAQVQGPATSWWCGAPAPDKIIAWDWVGSTNDFAQLGTVFPKAGTPPGHGFLIGELPTGCFNVWKTSPVSMANFVQAIDTSAGGLLTKTPAVFLHAWLWLIDAANGAEAAGFLKAY